MTQTTEITAILDSHSAINHANSPFKNSNFEDGSEYIQEAINILVSQRDNA